MKNNHEERSRNEKGREKYRDAANSTDSGYPRKMQSGPVSFPLARISTVEGKRATTLMLMTSLYAGNLVGHTLGSRFRLTALLGVGASARVYLAEDIKLRRRVAVKLLHSSLASDEAFLRRFQREAEVLGPLSHPNIVIVHDVNHRENALGEPPYLVTEYLAGGSLRNLLDTGLLLTPSQACLVGLGSARGLQFAHAHGLVHRDIKPANLLFGDDQRVRISDFGLARALTEHARTEPEGALVGTARYLSPEQAKGQNLDGRSDVYSLALVLAESMSGTVPFSADTWQGTAFARLDGPIASNEIYGDLNDLLVTATSVDPSKRLDAAGFSLALEDLARHLPAAESLPLDGSRVLERAALLDERDPTLFAGVGSLSDAAANAKASQTPGFFDGAVDDRTMLGRSDEKSRPKKGVVVEEKLPRKKRRFLAPIAAALVGAVAAGGLFIGLQISRRIPTHPVPTLTGLQPDRARVEVSDEKFVINTLPEEFSDTVEKGRIIRQDPQVGVVLKEKSVLTITVSKGKAPVQVPNLINLSLEGAANELRAVGLTYNNPPLTAPSDLVPPGLVIGWSPRTSVEAGATISITISSGPDVVEVPKVKGLSPEEATTLLETNFTVTRVEIASDVKKGIVTGTDIKSGEKIKKGSPIRIYVSKGVQILEVPNVINMSVLEATAKLRAAGFSIGNTIGPADLPVLHTRPIRRQKVKAGTRVTLYTTEKDVPEVPGITDRVAKTAVPNDTKETKDTKVASEPSSSAVARELPVTTAAPAPSATNDSANN